MLSSSAWRTATVSLTAAGLVLGSPQIQAAGPVSTASGIARSDARLLDILLQEGALRGRVVDHTGAPVPKAVVEVLQNNTSVASTLTDAQGQFAIPDLKTGVYTLVSGKTVGVYRGWQKSTAPPSAKEQALLVLGQNGARGQYATVQGGVELVVGLVGMAALIVGVLALERANNAPESN